MTAAAAAGARGKVGMEVDSLDSGRPGASCDGKRRQSGPKKFSWMRFLLQYGDLGPYSERWESFLFPCHLFQRHSVFSEYRQDSQGIAWLVDERT